MERMMKTMKDAGMGNMNMYGKDDMEDLMGRVSQPKHLNWLLKCTCTLRLPVSDCLFIGHL